MSPYISHPLVAALDTLVLSVLAALLLPLFGVQVPYLPIVCAVIVSAVYYGREADSVEHALKNVQGKGWFVSFVLGKYAVGWGVDNLLQWMAAAAGSAVAGAALYLLTPQ